MSSGELADCASVSVRVFDLIASPDSESEIVSVSSQIPQLNCGVADPSLSLGSAVPVALYWV